MGRKNKMESRIRFGELRTVISRIDRLSICMKETLQYENYENISQVPEKYDDYSVYGIGMICSEFSTPGKRVDLDPTLCSELPIPEKQADLEQKNSSGIYLDNCLEIMLYIPSDEDV